MDADQHHRCRDEFCWPRLPPRGLRQPAGDAAHLRGAPHGAEVAEDDRRLGREGQALQPAADDGVPVRELLLGSARGPKGKSWWRLHILQCVGGECLAVSGAGAADACGDAGAGAAQLHRGARFPHQGYERSPGPTAVDRIFGHVLLRLRREAVEGGSDQGSREVGRFQVAHLRLGPLGAELAAGARALGSRSAGRATEVLESLLRGHRQAAVRLLQLVCQSLLACEEDRCFHGLGQGPVHARRLPGHRGAAHARQWRPVRRHPRAKHLHGRPGEKRHVARHDRHNPSNRVCSESDPGVPPGGSCDSEDPQDRELSKKGYDEPQRYLRRGDGLPGGARRR
mmetsp:Transcript_74574/g.189235  ORF Transcript_74574/g.189235 Transcript_74574/m.189235 type:complete len:340 (+) Transcript_74574:1906-2925(+)